MKEVKGVAVGIVREIDAANGQHLVIFLDDLTQSYLSHFACSLALGGARGETRDVIVHEECIDQKRRGCGDQRAGKCAARAPASFASWPTSEPTGPVAAATTAVSPGCG